MDLASQEKPAEWKPPPLPVEWSYSDAVATARPLVVNYADVRTKLLDQLWVAREKLSVRAEERNRDATGSFVPVDKTWDNFCQDIGIPRRTVNWWLKPLAPTLETADTPTRAEPATCTVEDLGALVASERRFSTIYADPPWQYGNQATRASTDNHYQTMTLEAMEALPIEGLCAKDAHLHMWTTNGFLFDAKRIIEAWGFTYKSCLVWVKPQMGIGNYWRVSHEFLLFGIRGKCPFRDHSAMSWIEHRRTKHSAKPGIVRDLIEKVSPAPYLELFARVASPGWTVWGNEIERDLFNTNQ